MTYQEIPTIQHRGLFSMPCGDLNEKEIQKGKQHTPIKTLKISSISGTFLVAQWLRLCASNAGGTGLIPGQGNKIPHAMWCIQKEIEKKKKFPLFLISILSCPPCSLFQKLHFKKYTDKHKTDAQVYFKRSLFTCYAKKRVQNQRSSERLQLVEISLNSTFPKHHIRTPMTYPLVSMNFY